MVTICVTGDSSLKKYWDPLLSKYNNDPRYQFIFDVDDTDTALDKAKFDVVFFTDYSAIPTYQTMTILGEPFDGKLVSPMWHHYMNNEQAGERCQLAHTIYKRDKEKSHPDNNNCHVYYVQ